MDINDLDNMITEWETKQDQANEKIKKAVRKSMKGDLMKANKAEEHNKALDAALQEIEQMRHLLESLKDVNNSATAVQQHMK